MLIYLSLSIWAILICFFYDLKVAISIPEKNSFTWFSLLCCAMFYMEFIFIVWIDHWHYLRKSCTVTLKNQILRWIIYIFTNHFLLFNLHVVNKILLTFLSIDSFLSTSHFWLRDSLPSWAETQFDSLRQNKHQIVMCFVYECTWEKFA